MPWIESTGAGPVVRWWTAGRGSTKGRAGPFRNRVEAKKEADRIRRELAAAKPLRPLEAIAWDDLIDRYVAAIAHTTEAHRGKARKAAEAMAKANGWKRPSDVTVVQVEALGAYHYRIAKALLRHAAKLGQAITPGVLFARRRARGARLAPPTITSAQQVADLIAAATRWSPADGALVHLIATYGHRAESLVGLTCAALDGHFLVMRVKSGDTVRRPISAATAALLEPLRAERAPDAPLFVGHLGRAWKSGSEFAAWWNHSVAPRGQGIVALRKWATTQLYALTGNAKTVAEIQGRRDPRLVLTIYAQADAEAMRSAVDSLPALPAPSTAK